jgi:DNA-binding transcriptional LysR family regulator
VDLRVLRYFIACVENKTMHAAAEAVHVSQPALSKAIGNMEEELGVILLDRHPRGVVPTRFGDTMYQYAKMIDSEMRQAVAEIDAMRGMTRGTVVVGVIPSMCDVMADVAAILLETFPGMEMRLKIAFSSELKKALLDGELDIALLLLPENTAPMGFAFDPLVPVKPCIAVRRGHPLAERSDLTLAELANYPWLIPDYPLSHRAIINRAFVDAGLPPPKGAIGVSTVVFFHAVLLQTDLISIVPSTLFSEHAADLALLQIDFAFPPELIGLAYRQYSTILPGAKAIMQLIRNRCAALPDYIPPAPQ